ncbi:MAG: cytochrome-c oxidase, cbb3-type subunit I [Oligoflexia bacterium]|nr:cytochrome-c oxidase, cbb3-type subunit I [Oligoflexia bacterium]
MSQQNFDSVIYDNKIVRAFSWATLIWGTIGVLVGVIIAAELIEPSIGLSLEWLSFGRLRPLHTNAVIFAFAGNAIFAGIYYSTQRLTKTRMFSDVLSWFHFWGWQAIILSAVFTLPFGITTSKEYAELEWPIDIAITVVWVAFAINFIGALIKRREKHMYVALWFYLASIITVAVLHLINSLGVPVNMFKSYSAYSGAQDALVQWWYGHNAVAFFLTTPFLGLMYYFLPKAADRPIYSYRLSIIHFWSLIFIYIWAGPHHLLYTALPEWAQSLGMVFSIMLWMPSWGGMINGLLTLRGAWDKVRQDPVLKFLVAAVTFYGMATFEGPLLSIKSVNALSHYTDWTIGHVHSGALGWNGFLTFGMLYWLFPKLYRVKLYKPSLATTHFWVGTVGILLYVVSMWASGITQGLMLKAISPEGRLLYPDFVETIVAIKPFYWIRLLGGILYLSGFFICLYNLYMTKKSAMYVENNEKVLVPPRFTEVALHEELNTAVQSGGFRNVTTALHRILESKPMTFTVLSLIAILIGGIMEIVPSLLINQYVPAIASVKPYSPLELHGRDMYIREGCYNCHSQMIRPFRDENMRYGKISEAGEFVYDHPFQWGSRRIGPDLHRIGGKYSDLWHFRHMVDPKSIAQQTVMPSYKFMAKAKLDDSLIPAKINAMRKLGVPYTQADVDKSLERFHEQANQIAQKLKDEGLNEDVKDKEIVAIIAYLQRLGVDGRSSK